MIESNSLIKASAGTGKTFALATRFIRQLLIDKVDPRTIVALTFSRAAAQEIYTKILERLCAAAANEAGAEKEWGLLLDDFRKNQVSDALAKLTAIENAKIAHQASDFCRLLRELIDIQHLGAIATLDSFILRIVKNFPKEMGFQNAVEVLDSPGESIAVENAVQSVLNGKSEISEAFVQAFVAAKGKAFPRTCLSGIINILNDSGWRQFVIDHPECREWTVASMCAALGVPIESTCPDLSKIPWNDIGRKNTISPEEQFVRFVSKYDGSESPLSTTEAVKKLMLFFWQNPDAVSYRYKYYRSFELKCGAEGAAAIRGAIRHLMNLHLKYCLMSVKARIDLVKAVEGVYERSTRRAGKLTFGDFTKFSGEEEFSERGIAIRNVQFRFDATFDHWALDEFQDTSELQWKCLRELVQNAADDGYAGGCRSAMAVGDLKQSIYTWRGASARPFEQISDWPAFAGCMRDFKESHRYGPNVTSFVNRVFGPTNIASGNLISSVCEPAIRAWSAGWVDHISNEPADYVRVVATPSDAGDEIEDAVLSTLYAEIKAFWERHQVAKSKETVGVLVRSNANGLAVAEYLRSKNLAVVWEGVNPVADVPVVESLLALLRLSIHPEDIYAWRTVNNLFPVRKLLLPKCLNAEAVSAKLSLLLTQQGLARTIGNFSSCLKANGGLRPHGLSCERLDQLVVAAVNFESRAMGGDIDGFVRYLAEVQRREIAVSPDTIRILTIHRSKGLGIDHIFVPLFEGDRSTAAIDVPSLRSPLYDGGAWVLPHLAKGCEIFNEHTLQACSHMRCDRLMEALRTYYVALTRSKRSLYVILPNELNSENVSKGLLMRDLIFSGLGGHLPYEAGLPPSFAVKQERDDDQQKDSKPRPWPIQGKREVIERISPSRFSSADKELPLNKINADVIFRGDYGAASQRGIEAHAAFQKIEWVEVGESWNFHNGLREVFERPTLDATVWRERRYEIFNGRYWETGQFDRVVFMGTNDCRRAIIYDFKTNACAKNETKDEFAQRMGSFYAPQLITYRRALNQLTGIPESRIEVKLALEATGAIVSL